MRFSTRMIFSGFVLGLGALWGFSLPAMADIVGGEDVTPRDPVRKSTVALYEPSADGKSGALCTASLISSTTAITAAHCFDPRGGHPVVIFGRDLHAPSTKKRVVSAVAIHPRWAKRQGRGMDQGDIAVVEFPGGLPKGYAPVPMASGDASVRAGKTATLAGFGISDARKKTGAGVLRKTRVKVLDDRPGKSEMILDQRHGHGACHGDSGGPAFVREKGRAVLAGVTNRGYPDGAPDDCAHRVVYTKVRAYRPWINRTQAKMDRTERVGTGRAGGAPELMKFRRHAHRRIGSSFKRRQK